MVTKRVVVLECDLCGKEAQQDKKGKLPAGWTNLQMTEVVFNARGTAYDVKALICPTCCNAILKVVAKRNIHSV